MTRGAFTVAIDGPAASGKGTIARAIGRRFDLAHLDTGLLYRAVGARVLAGADPVAAAEGLTRDDLEAPELRSAEAGEAASRVAADPGVRRALLDFQRAFARRAGGAVLDGRDIATVICPEAEVKLFVTADDRVRAGRRLAELRAGAGGRDLTLEDVLADLARRDARDAARADAPLKPAQDAVLLDTTAMTIDEAVDRAGALVAAALRESAARAG